MDINLTIFSIPAVALLFTEFIKWIVRKVKNDVAFDLPTWFYSIGVPVLQVPTALLLLWLGVIGELPAGVDLSTWEGVVRTLLLVVLSAGLQTLAYNEAVAPLKAYAGMKKAGA